MCKFGNQTRTIAKELTITIVFTLCQTTTALPTNHDDFDAFEAGAPTGNLDRSIGEEDDDADTGGDTEDEEDEFLVLVFVFVRVFVLLFQLCSRASPSHAACSLDSCVYR